MTTMRFATWNLDYWQRRSPQRNRLPLIQRAEADVFALQEVRGSLIRTLENDHDGPALFSQELYEPASRRWMGCALLLPPGSEVLDAGVLEKLPKPQRSLWATAELPAAGRVTFLSWHAPNRAGDGLETKMAGFRAASEWLESTPRPLVVGADLNTWHDAAELSAPATEEEHYEELKFVGLEPSHGLLDAYRAVLEARGELTELRRAAHAGPLATSHVLSNGARHRMDRIYISPELQAIDGEYWHDEALEAGSDHALHWVDLEV